MSVVLNIDKFILDVFNRPAIWNRNYHCNKSFMEETWEELSALHELPTLTLKAKWKGLRDNFRVEFKRIPRNEVTGDLLIPPKNHETKWLYYKPLLFLVDHMRARQPKLDSSVDQYYYSNNDSTEYDTYEEPTIMEPRSPRTIKNSLIPEILDNDLHILKQTPTMNLDGVTLNVGTLTAPKTNHINNLLTNGVKRKRPMYDDNNLITEHQKEVPQPFKTDDDYHFLMSLYPFMTNIPLSQKLKVRMKIQKLLFRELYKDEDIDDIK